MPKRLALHVVALLAIVLSTAGCAPAERTPLKVFIAGSVMIPFDSLEKAYEAAHPDVDVEIEAHGSIQVIRHVTDIHQIPLRWVSGALASPLRAASTWRS